MPKSELKARTCAFGVECKGCCALHASFMRHAIRIADENAENEAITRNVRHACGSSRRVTREIRNLFRDEPAVSYEILSHLYDAKNKNPENLTREHILFTTSMIIYYQ